MKAFVNHADTFLGRALSKKLVSGGYTLTGTYKQKTAGASQPKSLALKEIAQTRPDIIRLVSTCDVIVYNILESAQAQEAEWVMQELSGKNIQSLKTFICLSPSLTWAKTKWMKEEEEEPAPLTEEDKKKRKSHPDYAKHLELEKYIIKQNKEFLRTLIVNYGLLYGDEEDVLHPLFKSLWHGNTIAPPIIGEGTNFVPTIHVSDVANITFHLINAQVDDRYFLAVDDANSTLKEIMETLAKEMGTKGEEVVAQSFAREAKEINDFFPNLSTVEFLCMDIKLKSNILLEMEGLEWHCKEGFVEKIALVVQEFRSTRKLTPMKILVHGPPAVGKTIFSEKLAKHYEVPHLKIKDIIDFVLAKDTELAEQVKEATAVENNEEGEKEEEPEEPEGDVDGEEGEDGPQKKKEAPADDPDAPVAAVSVAPAIRIPDEFLVKIVRKRLQQRDCRNQGYVLDGFPKTLVQAMALFGENTGESSGGDEEQEQSDPHIFPEYMIELEAPEEELKHRLMILPESDVVGTHNTEEGFKRRFQIYQESNTEDQPLVSFFDEKDVLVLTIDTRDDMEATFTNAARTIGTPHNYGPTPAMIAEAKKQKEAAAALEAEKAKKLQLERDEEEKEERMTREAFLAKRKEEIDAEERKIQQILSMPLRQYLMDKVMPVLIEGLLDVSKTRPPDAVDYLAEYLFRKNPQEEGEE